MANQMNTNTRWEQEDHRLHQEQELPATKAKQANTGKRILTVLIAALVLAFIVWIPVEIWGSHKEEQSAAQQTPAQSQIGTAPSKSAPETPAEVDAQQPPASK